PGHARLDDPAVHARSRRGREPRRARRHPRPRRAARARARRRAQAALWRGHARGSVLRSDRAVVRGGGSRRRRRGSGGVRMSQGAAAAFRYEFISLAGVVERNVYLVRRYIWWDLAFFVWTVANTLTIVFIAKGIPAAGGSVDVDRLTTILLVGAVIWAYLGI